MSYGWTGFSLEVDLTNGRIEKRVRSAEFEASFLGGKGANAKLFWDRVPPDTPSFSPENLLIFGSGMLTGTFAPAANRAAVTTISPVTHLLTYASIGGFWAAELRYAGYDDIVISGKSPHPVYLWIQNDHVEIRDAHGLWGKDTLETRRLLRKAVHNDRAQVLCIGPAGENKVNMASIEHDYGASASRSGVGAVMGDKKLKAIVVQGTGDIHLARPADFHAACLRILQRIGKLREFVDDYSHQRIATHISGGASGNMGKAIQWPEAADIHKEVLKSHRIAMPSCSNCPVNCKSAIQLAGGGQAYVKCLSWVVFALCCKKTDFLFNVECYHLCEKYGLDSISTSKTLAFAMDLYEKGILTASDTGGVPLEFGNADTALFLIDAIARREGIGTVLADGICEAARQIGRGAEAYTFDVKKLETPPYGLFAPFSACKLAINDRADGLKQTNAFIQRMMSASREAKEAFIKSGFFPYPKEFEPYVWDPVDHTGSDFERQSHFLAYDGDKTTLADCTGICTYWVGHWLHSPIHMADMAELVSSSTGTEMDENGAVTVTRRVAHVIRAYHVIQGLRRKDDTVPDKYFRDTPAPPRQTLDRKRFDRTVREYYALRGWNDEGIPTGATLDAAGLTSIRQELERRGLL